MAYEIFDEGIGLLFRFRDDVTFEEILIADKKGWSYPGWNTHRYQIWDFGKLDTLNMDKVDVLAIAKMDSVAFNITQPMKGAFIAQSEQVIDALENYIAALGTDNLECRIFGDEAAARDWVGV